MQAALLRAVSWRGRLHSAGTVMDVPDKTFDRWVAAGIALAALPQSGGTLPAAPEALVALPGIGDELAAVLAERGIETVDDLRATDDAALLAVPGIGPKTLERLRVALASEPPERPDDADALESEPE